jgi:hypothetical protein
MRFVNEARPKNAKKWRGTAPRWPTFLKIKSEQARGYLFDWECAADVF